MAYNNGPRIVTDGLVMCLDAGNPKSYPGAGAVWKDLSGANNNGTLQGGCTFSSANKGAIVLDGTNGYVSTTAQFNDPQEFSLSVWFKSTDTRGRIIIGFEDTQTGELSTLNDRMIYIGEDGKIYFGIYDSQVRVAVSGNVYNDGFWHNITAVYDNVSDVMSLYIDGKYAGGSSASFAFSYSGYFRIGCYPLNVWPQGTSGYLNGSIGLAHIYNRRLSSQEVLQNFNATKGRFGL